MMLNVKMSHVEEEYKVDNVFLWPAHKAIVPRLRKEGAKNQVNLPKSLLA